MFKRNKGHFGHANIFGGRLSRKRGEPTWYQYKYQQCLSRGRRDNRESAPAKVVFCSAMAALILVARSRKSYPNQPPLLPYTWCVGCYVSLGDRLPDCNYFVTAWRQPCWELRSKWLNGRPLLHASGLVFVFRSPHTHTLFRVLFYFSLRL